MFVFNCEICGVEKRSYDKDARYCSYLCKAKAQRKPHPFTCAICGKPGMRGTRCIGQSPQKYCGIVCMAKGRKLQAGHTARNLVLGRYKYSARARKLEWGLSDHEALILFGSNCHYCGRIPSTVSESPRADGMFLYNGIDRTNNSFGYVPSNVVPCCKMCNTAKGTLSLVEFVGMAKHITAHLRKRNRKGQPDDRMQQLGLCPEQPILALTESGMGQIN